MAIALFRRENRPLLERALSALARRPIEAGIIGVSHIIVDGTKVHENASNSKIIHRKFFEEVRGKIDEWMSASAQLDAEEELREKLSSAGVSTASRGVDGLQSLVDKCSKAVQEGENSKAKKVSITDPESRFMRDGIGSQNQCRAQITAGQNLIARKMHHLKSIPQHTSALIGLSLWCGACRRLLFAENSQWHHNTAPDLWGHGLDMDWFMRPETP